MRSLNFDICLILLWYLSLETLSRLVIIAHRVQSDVHRPFLCSHWVFVFYQNNRVGSLWLLRKNRIYLSRIQLQELGCCNSRGAILGHLGLWRRNSSKGNVLREIVDWRCRPILLWLAMILRLCQWLLYLLELVNQTRRIVGRGCLGGFELEEFSILLVK